MATQTIEFAAPSGQTLTAKLFAYGSDTQVASVSATEATNRKGVYTAAFTDVAAGTYRLLALTATPVPVATYDVVLTATTATFQARESVNAAYLHDDILRSGAYDESTAFPLASADSGSTQVARTGADGDTLETLSDQLDGLSGSRLLQQTTIATLTSQTEFTLTAGSSDDDAYNDCTVILVDQSTSTQKAITYCAKYTGSTKTVQLLEAPVFTVATGDTVIVIEGLESVRVVVDAVLTTAAGAAMHVAAWLDLRGRVVPITGASCSIAFRELSSDADEFTALTNTSDALGTAAIDQNVFRLTKTTPGFTDDRLIVVTASITLHGRTFTGKHLLQCLGA